MGVGGRYAICDVVPRRHTGGGAPSGYDDVTLADLAAMLGDAIPALSPVCR